MTAKKLSDIAASVRQRLLNVAREQGEDFQLVLTRFVLERLLYRLGCSDYRDQFILKGAMLFSLWGGMPHRATRDIDLLGFGENEIAGLVQMFHEICHTQVEDDGVMFLAETVRGVEIREDQEYDGVRITLEARMGTAKIPVQVDMGFGDAEPQQRNPQYIRSCSIFLHRACATIPVRLLWPRNSRQWFISAWLTVA
jgi:hypothetical protein